jgi:holin-like protein
MIKGLVQLLLFQGLGEVISKLLGLPIPGPVVGLMLLLMTLLIRNKVDPDLDMVATGFTQNLGLLFIPAAVGVVMFIPQLAEYGLVIALILIISVGLSVAASAITLKLFTSNRDDNAASEPASEKRE